MKKVKEGGKGVRLCLLGFYFYLDIHLSSYKYLDVNFVKEHLVRCGDSGRSSVFCMLFIGRGGFLGLSVLWGVLIILGGLCFILVFFFCLLVF